jgi:CheY-like chemotaxis protein
MNDRSVVLFVNDNPRPQRLLTSILEDGGFQVKTADGALEAMELIRGNSFALALLDYQMPEMTGAQLAQEIRVMDPALPIILLSGLTFLPAGELIYVDAHIGHGSTLEDLMEMMRALMERESTLIGAPESVRNKAATVAPGVQ